jgi:GxxExxY protein
MQRNNQGTKAAKEDRNSPPDILARRVIGCAIEVHRALGPGFLESVYEEALAVEMGRQRIPYSRQHPVSVYYRGHLVGGGKLDFLVGEVVVVELKAVEQLAGIHKSQVLSYLKATGLCLGLLLNFKAEVLREGICRVRYFKNG